MVFAIGVIAWIVSLAVFEPRKQDSELARIIADNTKALTELSGLIEQQGQMVQTQGAALTELTKLFNDLRLEIAREGGVRLENHRRAVDTARRVNTQALQMSAGYWTIRVGRNLEAKGLTRRGTMQDTRPVWFV